MDNEKLKNCFNEMVVYKDLKKSNFFSSLSLPSFLRDWLLKKFEDENGKYDAVQVSTFIKEYIPRKSEWLQIKDRITTDGERVKFLARISADIDIKTQNITFSLPDFGLNSRETTIDQNVWEQCRADLLKSKEVWGLVELGYHYPDGPKNPGKIKLLSFKNFCPYTADLDFYKEARKEFTINEWIDIVLGAIDYNPDGYDDEVQKLTMVTRLLPFVEKRLNLIELAPKGTGKSYLFGMVSRYGWLSTGGVMSRAKLFYDVGKRQQGIVFDNDFVAMDEVQTITFTNTDEMRGALKGYMESGTVKIPPFEGTASAGIVLLGNISKDHMNEYQNMFEELPEVFQESALLDRFHGFIKGWDIPRMHDDLKACGWALNAEYFCTIMHMLRDDGTYRNVVDQIVVVPEHADTRDTEAVKRIATAYMKLLFPNVSSPADITDVEFRRYCLNPAMKMRRIIRFQLGLLDKEYAGKDIPEFTTIGATL